MQGILILVVLSAAFFFIFLDDKPSDPARAALPPYVAHGWVYRVPGPGDKGRYFVADAERTANGFRVISGRVAADRRLTGFTEVAIDCDNDLYKVLAYNEYEGQPAKPPRPLRDSAGDKWTALVPGSSKSDLVIMVCNAEPADLPGIDE